MTLYTKIKYELMLRDETVADLLAATGLSPATISNIKKARPYRTTYQLLAEYFNLELVDLYLLPITRDDVLKSRGYGGYSSYNVLETVNKSELLPFPEGMTMKKHLENLQQERINQALIELASEDLGREVTLDEAREYFSDKRND